jgi:cell division septation protein DedD
MPKNEEGEFELILGNKQLLSVFFIVVILLGVFFTMGYMVGRSSSPLETASNKKGDGKPLVVDSPGRPSTVAAAPSTPQESTPAPKSRAAAETPTKPPSEAAASPKPAQEEKSKPSESASPVPDEPQPGQTYLQLVAVQRSEAELFVDVLSKKGFHALYVPHPQDPKTFRVLVGPFKDPGAIAQARTDLQKAGFKGFDAIVRKY